MPQVNPITAYLALADQTYAQRCERSAWVASVAALPPLDTALLDRLAQTAEEAALTEPRRAWAITMVAERAARAQKGSLWLRSLAAWYLGRACNHWSQPKRVNAAIARARRGFERLDRPGWVAACDWQVNLLAWARPNFVEAVAGLTRALDGMRQAGMTEFVPQCQLALAYAQILVGALDQAGENLRSAEEFFAARGDLLNQARCWVNQASRVRRQARFDDTLDLLARAQKVFEEQHALADLGKVTFSTGQTHLLRTDDLSVPESYFEKAAHIFTQCDLDLWRASCFMNLGSVNMQSGQLAKANEYYQKSYRSFSRHNVLSFLADNLNDNGKLNTLRGFPQLSVRQYQRAIQIYAQLGGILPQAVYMANLGEAYGQLGRYQDALHYLENAAERLQSLKNYMRLGTCEKYTALIWSRLGQVALAHTHLDRAAEYYELTKQQALLASIHNARASLYFDQGEPQRAVECLEKAFQIAVAHGTRPQMVLAQRLLGEAFLRLGQGEKAREVLEQALAGANEVNANMEQAACLVALGAYHLQAADLHSAGASFQEALALSAEVFPELEWRTYVLLANLAEAQQDGQAAMEAYRRAGQAFSRLRQNFWQPAVAGTYLHSQGAVVRQAIRRMVEARAWQPALQFIEANKATTLLYQLSLVEHTGQGKKSRELDELKAEIGWLQDQMKASFERTSPVKSALRSQQTRVRLGDKVRQYDALVARLERQGAATHEAPVALGNFDLERFRALANQQFGQAWVALDEFLLDDCLVTALITPETFAFHRAASSTRVQLALDACLNARQSAQVPDLSDLKVLGDFLVPAAIAPYLRPETILLIAPHSRLHAVPWAALQPQWCGQPLVLKCIPVCVPSLHNLATLWKRAGARPRGAAQSGLLVGVSHFQGRHADLPFVEDEIEALRSRLGPAGVALCDAQATWENLKLLKQRADATPQEHYLTWMHVASHVFADMKTGRLSGMALWDGDIWLDQLRDLSPLPNLVTFSACNSIYSYVYEGDEHIGIATTCLVAGANSVVGSLWPVVDRASAHFMTVFYEQYLAGQSPAQAVALAQRQMISDGMAMPDWAGFAALGMP